jgi:hypothetical protein
VRIPLNFILAADRVKICNIRSISGESGEDRALGWIAIDGDEFDDFTTEFMKLCAGDRKVKLWIQ